MKRTIQKYLLVITIKVCFFSVPFSLNAQEVDTLFINTNDTTLAQDSLNKLNRAGRGSAGTTTLDSLDNNTSSDATIEDNLTRIDTNNNKAKKEKKLNKRKNKIRDTRDEKVDTLAIIDTTAEKPHSPKRATYYSMLCPGLGQIYNKKYWKLPILYGGFAGCAIAINYNTKHYRNFKTAYIYATDNDSTTNNNLSLEFKPDVLLRAKDEYRKNMELSYIITGLLYILNIVDAAVDAHLYDFNVNDDLSMRLEPTLNTFGPTKNSNPGLKLTLKF